MGLVSAVRSLATPVHSALSPKPVKPIPFGSVWVFHSSIEVAVHRTLHYMVVGPDAPWPKTRKVLCLETGRLSEFSGLHDEDKKRLEGWERVG